MTLQKVRHRLHRNAPLICRHKPLDSILLLLCPSGRNPLQANFIDCLLKHLAKEVPQCPFVGLGTERQWSLVQFICKRRSSMHCFQFELLVPSQTAGSLSLSLFCPCSVPFSCFFFVVSYGFVCFSPCCLLFASCVSPYRYLRKLMNIVILFGSFMLLLMAFGVQFRVAYFVCAFGLYGPKGLPCFVRLSSFYGLELHVVLCASVAFAAFGVDLFCFVWFRFRVPFLCCVPLLIPSGDYKHEASLLELPDVSYGIVASCAAPRFFCLMHFRC